MKKWKRWTVSLLCVGVLSACQQAPEETDRVKEEPVKDRRVSLTFTGDLLFEQSLYDSWDNYAFGDYFDLIRPYLCGDIVIGNQEVPIGGEELEVSGTAYSFNAPVAIAEQLPQVGFDVLTLSNNHSYDRGYEGAVNTLENLRANDILPVGLYADETSAKQIAIVEENGIRIAILAYTYDTNIAPEDSHAFVTKTFLNEQGQLDDAHRQMLKEDVEQAQEQADVVIAAMHWGNEFTFERNAAQTQTAAYLNDLGVDIIIGNHPHCLQTMERLTNAEGKETWVFYSLGNLVSAAAMVDRASVDFANLYEMGGIVNLDVVIDGESGEVRIEHARLTPVINHFDVNYSHFQLIPLKDYTEELAAAHCQRQYSASFSKAWLEEQLHVLFDRKIRLDL